MKKPMLRWVGDDAHISEMTRPLSGLMDPQRISFFTDDDRAANAGTHGAMTQRMNKARRKRAANINMPEFWRLHAMGVSVAVMALALGVSTRSVERAMTTRPRDG